MTEADKQLAEDLHEQATELEDDDAKLAMYQRVLALNPNRPETLYNIGLIHKYRSEWALSEDFNQRAVALAPDDEAANWNLAIAATAQGHWDVARSTWQRLGMKIAPGEGPIDDDFGMTPVRLNPDGEAEVVWGRRIDPVRVRIGNIPFPDSGFRAGDVVLHDGAAVGYREHQGRECPVFNVLMLIQPSSEATYELRLRATRPEALEAVEQQLDEAGFSCEDWSANIQVLCKACSEGRPHEKHEAHGGQQGAAQAPAARRRDEASFGVSAVPSDDLAERIKRYLPSGVVMESLTLRLAPPASH